MAASASIQLESSQKYSIGWISCLSVERAAAKAMLDSVHDDPKHFAKHERDSNIYTWGSMGKHNIVIASLAAGRYGTTSAAVTAQNMLASLPHIKFGLLVGIGAGIPWFSRGKDIRFGDVVISRPSETYAGVVQYDLGKVLADNVFEVTGLLNSPPEVLLKGIGALESDHTFSESRMKALMEDMLRRHGRMRAPSSTLAYSFMHQGEENDRLFHTKSEHNETHNYDYDSKQRSCFACDATKEVKRKRRSSTEPYIFYGTIASGDSLIEDRIGRDKIVDRLDSSILCFEMEAAGLMNNFPCLVIRGICDYADAHKNDRWQPYAAATAAAYTKELLSVLDSAEVERAVQLTALAAQIDETISEIKASHRALHQAMGDPRIGGPLRLPPSNSKTPVEDVEDTRTDILQIVNDWSVADHSKPIFWLNGIAGTGKSTIARTLARHWKATGRLAGTFFFSRNERQRTTITRFVRTIVAQMIRTIPSLRSTVAAVLANDKDILSKDISEQFGYLLLQPLISLGPPETPEETMLVVIDALDECTSSTESCKIVSLLAAAETRTRIRSFVTCRPEAHLLDEFSRLRHGLVDQVVLHEVTGSTIRNDLAIFLRYEFAAMISKPTWRGRKVDWPSPEAIDQLARLSQPLFIFAKTICRYINDVEGDPGAKLEAILSEKDARKLTQMQLTYLPVLEHILQRYPSKTREQLLGDLRRLLGAILVASEPISQQMLEAFGFGGQTYLLESLRPVLHVPDCLSEPIRVFHQSFRDFVLRDDREGKSKESHPFAVNIQEAHADLSARCIGYLSRCTNFKDDMCHVGRDNLERDEVPKGTVEAHINREMTYACRFWISHLRDSCVDLAQGDEFHEFLKVHLLHWIECLMWLDEFETCVSGIRMLQNHTRATGSALKRFLFDANRFILHHCTALQRSPPQIYACRNTLPKAYTLRELISDVQMPDLRLSGDAPDEWTPEEFVLITTKVTYES